MTIAITLRDALESEVVDADFTTVLNAFNMTGAQGKKFVVLDTTDGHNVMYNLDNVLKAKELDD